MIIWLGIIVTLSYLIIIGALVYGLNKVKDFQLENILPKTRFSVVIPFRNEALNLPSLLKSVIDLQYPKDLFEIIFIDDESTDNSIEIINSFNASEELNAIVIKNKRNTNSPKKDAITKAVSVAKNKWIITTDADCILPKYWLDCFDEFIQKTNAKCIVAPVIYEANNTLLEKFQLLNILSLQGTTIGSFGIDKPFLCNGANFAYTKQLFIELNGFHGNSTIASGDDIFFLEKALKKHKNHVKYLKCHQAIVATKPELNWSDLISQNIRWATKTSAYSIWLGKFIGILVLLMNAQIVIFLILSIINIVSLKAFFWILILKFGIDFHFISRTSVFFNQKRILKSFPLSFLIYPFFSVYVAFLSVFKDYKWKGRTFKK
ncbi:glycosyltransferase [Yeosuana sp. MJ-SS3]|uniref:Glycosyltransferase n=1 Tax=Gilvirhabdus luticola TaxID=3079858 RepID=A0ABU3U3V6_9FLAO|nr:glycosyltransferase [Yeosuana sp. MJ-SS3]MDU8885083.1 glycosyltransferase [Yeosuana sp. MJ-SS3]